MAGVGVHMCTGYVTLKKRWQKAVKLAKHDKLSHTQKMWWLHFVLYIDTDNLSISTCLLGSIEYPITGSGKSINSKSKLRNGAGQ